MASGSTSIIPSRPASYQALDTEERKGLLHATDTDDPEDHPTLSKEDDYQPRFWSRRKTAVTALALIGLLITGTFARTALFSTQGPLQVPPYEGPIFSNGTESFKRTVLLVSIDGLSADYLDRGLTPHLLALSKKGLRAKALKPIFPTLTFPNHWALMTGLYAESHGMVANNFWDPVAQVEFHYNQVESVWNPSFWLGEPMWETAEKAGIVTANLMWPGPPKTTSGVSSTYFVPWKNKVPLKIKHNQIMQWIDLPFDKRPQFIMAYEPSLDQAGHLKGPNSKLVNETLIYVDKFAKDIHDSLAVRNLTNIVDIVFVSDHGMTDTSHPEQVFINDILGKEGLEAIEHEDGWPAVGLRFRDGANVTKHLSDLLEASYENSEKFSVYTHESMPERYHFANHDRIAPIYLVPEIGYVLTTNPDGDDPMSKGNHGYDNEERSMQAMFVAHGPFSTDAKAQHQSRSLVSRDADKGWLSTSHDTYIMQPFQNVEIYNLIMKLLGISEYAAPTNGTNGFWDQYL
ncbi:Phosphodiest-domain-containing protein [Pholiota conissans]|uniref:Phosphodiest-domain-containing protein n=1 Tax=Pholiota conissans TaxID=109636 RepID=A0A9P5ZAW9_9AGAR|nr:Phosphodiest-domain-containing protein [Pholiota conissans]